MAGILINRLRRALQRNHQAPWLGPSVGIVDGKFVSNRFGILTREPFRGVQLLTRDILKGARPVVRRVNYQRVALPVAAGISLPLLEVRRWMRAVVNVD